MTNQQPRKNLVAALLVAGLLLAGGATAIIALTSPDSGTSTQPPTSTTNSAEVELATERDAAVEFGTEVARAFTTLDHTTIVSDLDHFESLATGDLLVQLKGSRDEVAQNATLQRSKTEGTVLSAALAEFDPAMGTARLLAAVSVDVVVNDQPTTRRERITITLTMTKDGWKANGLSVV